MYKVITASDTTVAPGGTLWYFVKVSNIGDAPTDGINPTTLTVTLPQGMSSTFGFGGGWSCSGTTVVTCSSTDVVDPFRPFNLVLLNVTVDPGAAEGPVTSTFSVDGGGAAASGQTVDPITITGTPPQFGVDAFDGQVAADAAGSAFTQAGGHPYAVSTSIDFNRLTSSDFLQSTNWPVEPTKDIFVDLPPGFVGNPTATGGSKCTTEQIAPSQNNLPNCPPGSQVGTVQITPNLFPFFALLGAPFAVYNMVAPPDVPARFGFNVNGTVVTLDAALRSGSDYGLSVNVKNVSEGVAISGTTLTFWGVPADPSHTPERSCPGKASPWLGGPSCATEVSPQAFIRLPTSCASAATGLKTNLRMDSWEHPGDFATASFTSHLPPAYPVPPSQWGAPQGPTGCQNEPFEPTITASPTPSSEAGAPAGLTVDLRLPQDENPDVVGTADLKKAVVTLPKGMRVSPSAATGLGACSSAQIGLHSSGDAHCPNSSKVGTVHIVTPLLEAPLDGSVYLAKPHDNPSSSLLGLYLVVKGPGVIIKLYGRVDADPKTGQLTTTFDDNPQLPFELLHLELKDGPRAPLVNPPRCGRYSTHAVFTSWNDKTVSSDSSFDVSLDGNGAPCPPPRFSPTFAAGTDGILAGEHSSFLLSVARDDSDQELGSLTVHMPQGLLARITGVPLCSPARAAAGTCGEASRVGSVTAAAGAGTNPFVLPGRVYLTGPYKAAPFGLSIVVPAIAGPFDLGVVVVRAQVEVDRHTAVLHVVSDPLPTILQGIPLQTRVVHVTVDRKRFIVNPTSCAQKLVRGVVGSTQGLTAHVAARFQVGGCRRLQLNPRMQLTVGGKGHTRARTSTPFKTVLTQTPGQANLKSVSVTLPLSLNAVLQVVTDACTQQEFDAGHCEKARAGSATAITPLLPHALRGGVYFVKDPNQPAGSLPNLIVALRGQVAFDLVGTIKIPHGTTLATKFSTVPDVPITKFVLSLVAGSHGPLGTAENLCSEHARRQTATIVFRGQNGRVLERHQRLRVAGCARGR